MRVRNYVPGDFEQIMAFCHKDCHESPNACEYRNFLARDDKEHLVIEHNDKAVVVVTTWEIFDNNERGLYFFGMADPDYYGTGIGFCLYQHILQRMVENFKQGRPITFLRATCNAQQKEIMQFFFDIGGEVINYYQTMNIELDNFTMQSAFPADFTLRTFTEQDIESYYELETEVFADHFTYNSKSLDEFRQLVSTPSFQQEGTLLLFKGAKLIGFCRTHFHDQQISNILTLGVADRYRNRGLGTNLLVHGLNYLKEKGAAKTLLAVDGANEHAFNLYQRLGFTVWRKRMIFQKGFTLQQVEEELQKFTENIFVPLK